MTHTFHQLWIHLAKRRYYRIRVQTDLLGTTAIVRNWGSLDEPTDGLRIDAVGIDEVVDIVTSVN